MHENNSDLSLVDCFQYTFIEKTSVVFLHSLTLINLTSVNHHRAFS